MTASMVRLPERMGLEGRPGEVALPFGPLPRRWPPFHAPSKGRAPFLAERWPALLGRRRRLHGRGHQRQPALPMPARHAPASMMGRSK